MIARSERMVEFDPINHRVNSCVPLFHLRRFAGSDCLLNVHIESADLDRMPEHYPIAPDQHEVRRLRDAEPLRDDSVETATLEDVNARKLGFTQSFPDLA